MPPRVSTRSSRASTASRKSATPAVPEDDVGNFGMSLEESSIVRGSPMKPAIDTEKEGAVPHDYEPEHKHSTRYVNWYSKNFKVDDEAAPAKKAAGGRRSAKSAEGKGAECEGGHKAQHSELHPMLLVIAILVAALAFLLFGSLNVKGGDSVSMAAYAGDISKMQSQHKSFAAENKQILAQIKELQAAVASDKSAGAIKKVDEKLEKVSSAVEKLAAKQGTMSSDHDKVVTDVAALRKDLAKGIKDSAAQTASATAELSARLEELTKKMERIAESGARAAAAPAAGGAVDLEPIKRAMVEDAVRQAVEADGRLRQELRSELHAALLEEVLREVESGLDKKLKGMAPKAAPAPAPAHAPSSSLGSWFDSGSSMEAAVRTVLRRMHDERVGSVDWALAINNASIVAHSQTYDNCQVEGGVFGSTLCEVRKRLQPAVQLTPLTVLKAEGVSRSTLEDSGSSYLGHCWAMEGAKGYITVRLDRPVTPSSVVLEHAPPKISPEAGWSAPRAFRLVGWLGDASVSGKAKNEGSEVELAAGEYTLEDQTNSITPHVQKFEISGKEPIDHVRLEVVSNHGNPKYTCLYHFRLNGAASSAGQIFPGERIN